MSSTDYRVYLDNEKVSLDRLSRFETITVEQEVDLTWEARIEIPICLDDRGTWTREHEDFVHSFGRVRIEVRMDRNAFVPLIDGPVVGYDNSMTSEPGQSMITAVVQDDSVYLNRSAFVFKYEQMLDDKIAGQLFTHIPHLAECHLDPAPGPSGGLDPVLMQRGTAIEVLHDLAYRQGMHAYVLPGPVPGKSIAYFQAFPSPSSDTGAHVPDLVLLGKDQNIRNFAVTYNAQGPAGVRTSTLTITNQQVVSSESSFHTRELLGDLPALGPPGEEAQEILPPRYGSTVSPQQATAGQAERTSYAFAATGSVLEGCYSGVLQPYRLVTVRIGNTPLSGVYRILQVTHRLTRSIYSQQFTLRRNALSKRSDNTLDQVGRIC